MSATEENIHAKALAATMTLEEAFIEMSLDRPNPKTGLSYTDKQKKAAVYKVKRRNGIKWIRRGILPRAAFMRALGAN